ncbi:3-beta hydroxysteroid dehydrogenase [Plantibacter sp. Leaf171]|uniref:SDR family oxidoreductase n=1 Tax=unclassified Plantibacter TaxID=2624265 RepID=UPI0006FCC99F|nr:MULTISPECIES: NAD(P)H-binding protein [unclassified Plantibacter]KQM17910.1 3-beta hydroxysteroid dehydrogenase [Plantibacter sp. Leaf1]KQR60691.1 3-beta hydroxysteroid dehydrogenase [Plantibacter sp. Leaf171]
MKIVVAGGNGMVGRHVVAVAEERGHRVVSLSRATGVDLVSGVGLAQQLEAADVVIDVTSTATQSAAKSSAFFGGVTRTLLDAEGAAGVPHHVALSIVGSDRAPFGYYAGKAVQEELVSTGRIPWTILRATQFHEFAQQMVERFRFGPVTMVPTMTSQPVAAHEVAERLVELAEGEPQGRPADLAGPEALRMSAMVKAYTAARGIRGPVIEIPLPGGFGKAMRDGTTLAGPDAQRGVQTFAQWIDGLRQAR